MSQKQMDVNPSAPPPHRRLPNPAIRASAAARLLCCASALLVLWLCVFWALG